MYDIRQRWAPGREACLCPMGERMRMTGAAAVKGSLRVVCLAATTMSRERRMPWLSKKRRTRWSNATGRFEIRDYDPQVLAETLVDGTLEKAGNQALGRTFRDILGANQSSAKLDMTAPVLAGAKVHKDCYDCAGQPRWRPGAQWAVSFMMPSGPSPSTACRRQPIQRSRSDRSRPDVWLPYVTPGPGAKAGTTGT